MNKNTRHLIERQEHLPQKLFDATTIFDRFFDILRQRTEPIELPDFFVPQIDVHESAQAVTLEMELPGMVLQDFLYRVDGDVIHIRGEKRRSATVTEGLYTRSERRYGLFERVLRLPAEVAGDRSSTIYEDGILRIVLAKKRPAAAEERPRTTPSTE